MDTKRSLSHQGISAVFWGGFGSALRSVLQIASQIVLARLLGPQEYGIFAIASVVLSFSAFFSDIGIAYGLIQKKSINNDDIRFVFTWQLVLGSVVSLALYFLADSLGAFFKEQRVISVIHAMAVICLINAIYSVSLNLLKRDLDFKLLQIAQIVSYVVGYILIGIPLAALGLQVWALVAAFLARELTFLFIVYQRVRHPLALRLWHHNGSHLINYGIKVFATNLINWIIGNIDRVIVGRVFTPAQIGLYSVSYNLVSTPTLTLINVIQSALFSTSAKIQDDLTLLQKTFFAMTGTVTLLIFPTFFCIAAVSETILNNLYGQVWINAAELLCPIALAMPFFLLMGISTPILWATGKTNIEFIIQTPIAIGFALSIWLAAQSSLAAISWVVFGMYLIRTLVIMYATCKTLHIKLDQFIQSITGGVIVTLITTLAITTSNFIAKILTTIPVFWIISDIVTAGLILPLLLVIYPQLLNPDTAELFKKISSTIPTIQGQWIHNRICQGQLKRSTYSIASTKEGHVSVD